MNYNHIPPDVMTKYLTDDLSDEEKRTAELHIAVCPECAARLDEQRRFEDAAARSYPRTFSGRLDADCAKAIDEAVREQLNTPGNSPYWTKRIRGTVVIQFFTVAAVALTLFLMITAPMGGSTGSKKKNEPAPKQKETALVPDRIPVPANPAAVKPSAVKQPAAAVPEKPAPAEKPAGQKEALNPGLIRLLALDGITLRPTEKETFRQGAVCLDSPFEPGIRIVLAVSAPKADPAEKRAGLRIHPKGRTVLLTVHAKPDEEDAVTAALLCDRNEDPASVFAEVISADGSAAPIPVSAKDVRNRAEAPAPLRLASVMLAAGKPRILLNRKIREKMIEELRSLANNEYAGSPQVARFLKKLEKVK